MWIENFCHETPINFYILCYSYFLILFEEQRAKRAFTKVYKIVNKIYKFEQ